MKKAYYGLWVKKKKEKAAWGKISCSIPKTPCAVVACPWHYQREEKESTVKPVFNGIPWDHKYFPL
jgi:hypothetical protein